MWSESFGERAELEAAKAQIAARRGASFTERQRSVRREMREQLIGRLCAVIVAGAAFAALVYFS
jgi:hypothetical protein